MSNLRTRKPRILIQAPIVPGVLDKKHVGTRVQFSRSTDFTDDTNMVYDNTTYLPDNITDIQITDQQGQPIQISLDDVYYFRYQLLYDSVSNPTNNPDAYTQDSWSVIASIYGDQEGFRFDHIILATPHITIEENNGTYGESFLIVRASGYKTIVGDGVHKYTTWSVETSDGETIFTREKDADNLEEFRIPLDLFKPGKLYNIQAKFISDTNGESNWGKFLYNRAVVKNDYMEITPVGTLEYGNELYFKLASKMPNVTGVRARLVTVIGNTEVDIPATITVSKQQLKIDPFTDVNGRYSLQPFLSIGNVFKLYIRPILNGQTNVIWTDMVYETFMLSLPDKYPLDPSSRYPGKYTMLKDLDLGPTTINSRELKNGIIPLIVSGSNKVKLFARYGSSLRPTNIEFTLPTNIGDNTIIPYLNVIELYDGNVLLNYVVYNPGTDYKKSVWIAYSVDYVSNTWTAISDIFEEPETYYGTSLSSSAVAGRDNKIYYVPAVSATRTDNPQVSNIAGRFLGKDYAEGEWVPYYATEDRAQFKFNIQTPRDSEVYYGAVGSMVHCYFLSRSSVNDNILKLTLPQDFKTKVDSTGYTIDFNIRCPKTNTPGAIIDPNLGEIMSLCAQADDKYIFKLGIKYPQDSVGDFTFSLDVSGAQDPDIADRYRKDKIHRVTLNITTDKVILYINGSKKLEKTHNVPLANVDQIFIGRFKKNDNTGDGVEFYFDNVNVYNTLLGEDEIRVGRSPVYIYNERALGVYSLELKGRTLVKQEVIGSIDPEIKLHVSLVPISTEYNNEEFLIIGGTNSTRIQADQNNTGIFRYDLLNRKLRKIKNIGGRWAMETIQSNGQDVELPQDILPSNCYSLCAQRRADGKIVIFNNSEYGPAAEDTSTYVLDLSKITDTELLQGWFLKDNNDSRINLPFKSTFTLKNGDFLRTSYLETFVNGGLNCKVLLYPHAPLTQYVDTDDVITVNKHLTVPVGKVISITNPYIYDTITINGTGPDDTGTLIWTDMNKKRVFDCTWKIVTRDLTVTVAEDRAQNKEKLFILDGVEYNVQN